MLGAAADWVPTLVAWTGAITALFAATIALAQNDIKKVLAYSTVSQLGYMFLGAGVGAFVAAIFHVVTHAFFKACLFLGSGSVIHACGGEQDMRRMGGLKRYMPTTYWTFLVATIAIAGIPPLAGFFSKDLLIEAVRESHWHGQGAVYWIAYLSVLLGVFVTALYSFRMFFLVFHGEERMSAEEKSHLHETPAVVTVPLILLAIPSAIIGWMTAGPVLFEGYFGDAIYVDETRDVLTKRYERFLRRMDQVNSDDVFEAFMNAYAHSLDPHSSYFSPRNADEYQIQMSLSYFGIGASLQTEDDYVQIINIIPGGPAAMDGKLKLVHKRRLTVGKGLVAGGGVGLL